MDIIWTTIKLTHLSTAFNYICNMKRLIGFVIATASILALLSACSHNPKGNHSRWHPSGLEYADLCVDSLEHCYGHNQGQSSERWLDTLQQIAAANPQNRSLRIRVAYWQVRRNLRQGNMQQAQTILDSALAEADSAANAGDFARLKLLRWRFDRNLLHRYVEGIQMLAYFRKINDSVSIATELMNLGDIMMTLADNKRGVEYCLEASQIWHAIGQEDYAEKNMLNVALMSPRHVTDSVHRALLANPHLRYDTAFYCLLLRNHYLNTDSVGYLLQARQLTAHTARFSSLHTVHNLLYSDWLAQNGSPDSAISLATLARESIHPTVEDRFKMLLNHALGVGYLRTGRHDSAARCLMRYVAIKDSIANLQDEVEKANKDARDLISAFDHEQRLAAERAQRTTWIVALVIVILLLIVMFFLYHRARESEQKAQRARSELLHARARVEREALITQENEQLLRSLEKEISDGETAGSLTPQLSAKLRTTMKLHNAAADERNAFLEVHDNMLPGFQIRLKMQYPALSEKQLKLAAYICAGMSSAAIARVLNISQASVMKSRYRLRTKLDLDGNNSLEAFLRQFTT